MAGKFLETLTEIFEVLNSGNTNPDLPAGQKHIRPIPIANIQSLLKENKKAEATAFLQNAMGWDHERAAKFIQGLAPASRTGNAPKTERRLQSDRNHSATHIDNIVKQHAQAESKASSSLFAYLFGKKG